MWGNTYNSKFKLIVLKFIDFQKEGFSIKNDQLQILFKETEKKNLQRGVFLKPPTNRPPTTDHLQTDHRPETTDESTTHQVHRPPTNWAPTNKKFDDQNFFNKF